MLFFSKIVERRLCLVYSGFAECNFCFRLDRLRREDDQRGRQSKKAQDAEQTLLNKVGC